MRFARAVAASPAMTTMATSRSSELCPHSPSHGGAGGWPEELAATHGITAEAAVAW